MSTRRPTQPHDAQTSSLPHQVVNLFAARLDVHQALQLVDTGPARHLHTAIARLDETIMTILHTGPARAVADGQMSDRLVIDTSAALADGLAGGFNLTDYLRTLAQRGADQPDIRAAAFILGEVSGLPTLAVAAPDQPALRELCQLRPSPGRDTCLSGQPQTAVDLITDIRWPLFATRAQAAGYRAVHAVPLRQQETILGALTLFSATPGALPEDGGRTAQSVADLATLGVLLHHAEHHREPVAERLADPALIEQAEAILAERHDIPINDVAAVLTTLARRHVQRLPDPTRAVIDGTTDPSDSRPGPRPDPPRWDPATQPRQ